MMDFEEKRPFEVPIVVLDTETTGLYPGLGHRVIEIGAVRLENLQIVGEMNHLLQPGRKIDAQATAVHGIDDDDLAGKPAFADIANEFLALTQDALLVAHNAPFDAEFIGMEFFICGRAYQMPYSTPILPNPWLCTLQLARRHFYFGQNHLENIARRLGVRMGQAHRALHDVHMTAEVLKRMVRELAKKRMETVGDLLHAQGVPIYTPPPPSVRLPVVITQALENGRFLNILYMSDEGETRRTITPLYPSQHKGVNYLVAYCHLRQEQRTFRLDRIFNAELV